MILNHLLKTILVLVVAGFVLPVSAHTLSNKTLRIGFGAQATDVWQIECMNVNGWANSDHFVAQVLDKSSDTNLVSLVIVKGTAAATTVDLIGGDATASPFASINGGSGIYTMLVNHTKSGNQVYNLAFYCLDATGHDTPMTTATTPLQDN